MPGVDGWNVRWLTDPAAVRLVRTTVESEGAETIGHATLPSGSRGAKAELTVDPAGGVGGTLTKPQRQ